MVTRTPISNPLTIVGIFATVTETAGSVVLPFLSYKAQNTYVWFLIGFPCLVAALFFLVLWYRPQVLFSPNEHGGGDSYRRNVIADENTRAFFTALKDNPEILERLKGYQDLTPLEDVLKHD